MTGFARGAHRWRRHRQECRSTFSRRPVRSADAVSSGTWEVSTGRPSGRWRDDMNWRDRLDSDEISLELRLPTCLTCNRSTPLQIQDRVYEVFLDPGAARAHVPIDWLVCICHECDDVTFTVLNDSLATCRPDILDSEQANAGQDNQNLLREILREQCPVSSGLCVRGSYPCHSDAAMTGSSVVTRH